MLLKVLGPLIFTVFSIKGLTRLCPSVSSSGYLVLDKPLDRESAENYTLVVTASDGHPDGVRKGWTPPPPGSSLAVKRREQQL